MSKKKRKRLRGIVQKVIKPVVSGEPEKAQIAIEHADDLYREIRIENVLTDEQGEKAVLKPGTEVDAIIEADSDATLKKLTRHVHFPIDSSGRQQVAVVIRRLHSLDPGLKGGPNSRQQQSQGQTRPVADER